MVKGKSTTRSKEDKVFNYIDSIKKIHILKKTILYALEYRSSDRESGRLCKKFIE